MTSPQYAGRKLLAALFAASLTLLAAPAVGAHAATPGPGYLPTGGFQLKNARTGRCLEPQEDYLATNYCDRQPTQGWTTQSGQIQNLDNGQCLEDFGNGDVHTVDCSDVATQQWDDRNGWLYNQSTGACLADAGGYAYTTGCDNQPNEQWIAERP